MGESPKLPKVLQTEKPDTRRLVPVNPQLSDNEARQLDANAENPAMATDHILSEDELQAALVELPGWEVREGWLRRTFNTPGWPHTMLLAQAIGYLAEAAWHHPDLKLGYAVCTVLLQTHRVKGITFSDVELAKKITDVALWKPAAGAALPGFPKKWVS
jgi:4a-hydroxytetrahydrobiopterin dehydratase